MKILSKLCILMVLPFAIACGMNGVTGPDDLIPEGMIISDLGYRIKVVDYEGLATQAHADLADRWWTELMTDLHASGYSEEQTDPNRYVEWVYILLYRPLDGDHSIKCPGRSDLVGGCYSMQMPGFRVPGTYIDSPMLGRRPASQPLKHEMLHHWCLRNFNHLCQQSGVDEYYAHIWPAPNDSEKNIWDYTWR